MDARIKESLYRILTVGMAIAAVHACATVEVGSDYDRHASFANYHTFTIMQREHHGTQNPMVAARTEEAIAQRLQQLELQRYVLADDPGRADFTVDFTIGSKDRTDVNTYPGMYAGGLWGSGQPDWWGAPYWGPNVDVRRYREGTLSIDIFDARTHRPVWHGWARKELTREDIQQSDKPIRDAIASVLSHFPPGAQYGAQQR